MLKPLVTDGDWPFEMRSSGSSAVEANHSRYGARRERFGSDNPVPRALSEGPGVSFQALRLLI